jgi:hypothetical protein
VPKLNIDIQNPKLSELGRSIVPLFVSAALIGQPLTKFFELL